MDILGIDVSSYQGAINWESVKASGVKFAIIKIIKKDSKPDTQFENNWKGCTNTGIEIKGVYNYSYATTVEKAVEDAKAVIKTLAGRKTTVWLDVEDSCQKTLGSLLIDIIEAYQTEIVKAGLQFGVYTGEYFYKTYIAKYKELTCPLWIASYGSNNGNSTESKRPKQKNCILWQYSSKGKVAGVSGNVDVNYFFKEVKVSKPAIAKPTLKRGSRGIQVKTLQEDLNYLYGNVLVCDGIFGNNTYSYLVKFQKEHKISPDGIYGKNSYNTMIKVFELGVILWN